MSDTRRRPSVALSDTAFAHSRDAAQSTGTSHSAWVNEAIEQRRMRDSVAACAQLLQDPDVAAQLAAFHAAQPAMPTELDVAA